MAPPIERFLREVAASDRAVLALDYDGTLAPFHRRPQDAIPYPQVRGLLGRIMASGRTRVVVVSGRPASEVLALLDLRPAPEIWGAHGWERLGRDGRLERQQPGDEIAESLAQARKALATHGILTCAEWKVASVAVHWRDAGDADAIAALAGAALKPLAARTDCELMPIVEGLEWRCRRRHKGTALEAVLAEEAPGVPAAYLGDDTTDEDAFRALDGRGLAVRVGAAGVPTAAAAHLEPGDGVVRFLERWREATTASSEPGAAAGRAT